jgi:hypothetical protein
MTWPAGAARDHQAAAELLVDAAVSARGPDNATACCTASPSSTASKVPPEDQVIQLAKELCGSLEAIHGRRMIYGRPPHGRGLAVGRKYSAIWLLCSFMKRLYGTRRFASQH